MIDNILLGCLQQEPRTLEGIPIIEGFVVLFILNHIHAFEEPRTLFEPYGSVDVGEETIPFEAASAEAWFEEHEEQHPAWRFFKRELEGRVDYAVLRRRCIEVLAAGNEVSDGFRTTSRCLLTRVDLHATPR